MKLFVRSLIYVVLRFLFRLVYRIRIRNSAAIPETGGVLLTPNHVSYIDAFIVSVASPRPVRFLMGREWYDKPFIGGFSKLFDCIPIAPNRSKDAIQKAESALRDDGSVVCMFPEGDLTRDGSVLPLQRGCELIARRAGAAVVPVRTSGLWGSIFSRRSGSSSNKALSTLVHGVKVEFGDPLLGEEVSTSAITAAISDPTMMMVDEA